MCGVGGGKCVSVNVCVPHSFHYLVMLFSMGLVGIPHLICILVFIK